MKLNKVVYKFKQRKQIQTENLKIFGVALSSRVAGQNFWLFSQEMFVTSAGSLYCKGHQQFKCFFWQVFRPVQLIYLRLTDCSSLVWLNMRIGIWHSITAKVEQTCKVHMLTHCFIFDFNFSNLNYNLSTGWPHGTRLIFSSLEECYFWGHRAGIWPPS